jgi:uncharacterized protein YndB with AHSA1/START domain
MATREIWHEILINASPADLYAAVTEVKKLAHWWTTDTRGESQIGKNLEFWFAGFRQVIEVTALDSNQLVRWIAKSEGASDWTGTSIEFRIFRVQGQTFLHFRHSNWREAAKTFPHCSLGWAIFLLSLKEFVETGKGRPYPYDLPVNMWTPPQ